MRRSNRDERQKPGQPPPVANCLTCLCTVRLWRFQDSDEYLMWRRYEDARTLERPSTAPVLSSASTAR